MTFRYAPDLKEGDLVLFVSGNYSYPVIFAQDTYCSVQGYRICEGNFERIKEGKKMWVTYISGSYVDARVVKITEDHLSEPLKSIYKKIMEHFPEMLRVRAEKERKKAERRIKKEGPFKGGDIVVVQDVAKCVIPGRLSKDKDYMVSMYSKENKQIMVVDDGGFPAWHQTKYFVKKEATQE